MLIPVPPPPLRDGYTVTPAATVHLSDLANFRPVAGIAHMEPNGWIVVGLDTNFFATTSGGVQQGLLLGQPASVRFTSVQYNWDYGDGSSGVRTMKGGAWRTTGTAEFDPTSTSHVFEHAGIFTIRLSIDFAAEYQWAGGNWTTIVGVLPITANELIASASDAKTVLVGRDCSQKPSGPGC